MRRFRVSQDWPATLAVYNTSLLGPCIGLRRLSWKLIRANEMGCGVRLVAVYSKYYRAAHQTGRCCWPITTANANWSAVLSTAGRLAICIAAHYPRAVHWPCSCHLERRSMHWPSPEPGRRPLALLGYRRSGGSDIQGHLTSMILNVQTACIWELLDYRRKLS